ncbi:MAG: YqaA family protein [Candidatus Woesearchaeota archaeon]
MPHKNVNHDIKHIKRHKRNEMIKERKHKKKDVHKKKDNSKMSFWIAIIAIGVALIVFREALGPYIQGALNIFENFLSEYDGAYKVYEHIKNAISAQNILGVGYVMFFLSLFFIPAPIEAVFIGFLLLPLNPIELILVSTLTGTSGHLFNYLIGLIFGRWILKRSKDKLSKHIEWFNKSGGILLFIFNYLPLPSQPASVIYGFTRYPVGRFLMITVLARGLKFITLVALFEYARPLLENIPFI